MKKILFLFIALNVHFGFAQQIIDIEADIIGIDYPHQLTFYKENSEGSYDKTILNSFNKEIVHYTQLAPHDELLNVETLQKQSAKKLIGALRKGLFLNQEKNSHSLSLGENEFVKVLSYQQVNGTPEWQYKSRYYFNYSLVRINQKYTLVYFISNNYDRYFGFLLPKKEDPVFSFSTNGDFPLTKDHAFQKANRKQFPTTVLDTFSPPFNLKFKITEEHQLVDYYSHQIVLDKKFDTLYVKNGFIIGRHNQRTFLYNQNLADITPKGLRTMKFSENTGRYDYSYPQVLVNNEIHFLSQEGKFIENNHKANCPDNGGWTSAFDFIRITEKNGEIWLKESLLSKDKTYEKAWFLNKKQELDIQRNYRVNLYENYLIVRKNEKYGIVKYTFNQERTQLASQIILPVKYDFIYPTIFDYEEQSFIIENDKLYGLLLLKTEDSPIKNALSDDDLSLPIVYDDISFINKCQPFLLRKNQLYGYSRIQEKAKYKTLEKFIFNFARFTLPNGKKGWLDFNGNEYLDQ